MKQGQHERAVADFTASLRLNAGNARSLFLRGTVHQLREQHEQALADFQQAVLLDPQYTAAYCNQRALLHVTRGEYEDALADYAIVLQLDETNLTALLGREHALQALKERPVLRTAAPAVVTAPVTRKPPQAKSASTTGSKTQEHHPAATQLIRVSKAAETLHTIALPDELTPEDKTANKQPAADAPTNGEAVDLVRVEEIAMETLIDKPVEAPPLDGETTPDRAVEPPSAADSSDDALTLAKTEASKPRVVGPMEARTLREQQQTESSERAKVWAEMRCRERQKQLSSAAREEAKEGRSSGSGSPRLRRVLVVLAILALVGRPRLRRLFHVLRHPRHQARGERDLEGVRAKHPGGQQEIPGQIYPRLGETEDLQSR